MASLALADKQVLVRVTAPHAPKDADIKLRQAGQVTGTVLGDSGNASLLSQVCALFVPADPNDSFGVGVTGARGHCRAGQLGLARTRWTSATSSAASAT